MMQLIKNFAISLKKSIAQIVGLVAALLILIGLFTGFWISSQFGMAQVNDIEGNYVDSMIVTPDKAVLNGNLWKNVNFLKNESAHDFWKNATIKIESDVTSGLYDVVFYNNDNVLMGQEKTPIKSQPTNVKYVFENPMQQLVKDKYYYDFDRLLKAVPDGIIHLLPIMPNAKQRDYLDSHLSADEIASYNVIVSSQKDKTTVDNKKVNYAADYAMSKRILWLTILGMNSTDYRYSQYFSYKDPRNQTSVQIFPDRASVDFPSFSDPIFSNSRMHNPLRSKEAYAVRNFAVDQGIKIDDSYSIMNDKYKVKDYAVNAIYNSNAFGAFKYNAAFWVSNEDYKNLVIKSGGMAGFFENSDMYFNATMLNRLNPQLFAGSNPLIDVTTDAHGDVYYANHLLSLFLMNESGSSLSNFYYKVPVPKHQEDEFMGIHRQRGMISERDSTLFSVLLIASAVLEIASIVMVVVVIAHLIKHNEKSIGVLKANGLNGFKIAFAISICFMLVLVFTGLLAVIFSALIGYILNLTYSGFTQMTSYSFIFIWYVAVVDFFLPIVLIIPFVAIFALLMIRKSPLVLIKGVSDKRITLISFKYHFDPFKYISKIHISFKHKLSFKFAFSARGKLFLTIVITLISTIGLYIVLNLMQTNTNMVGGVNDQFVASNIYGYGKQNLENQDGSIAKKDALNYYFYNESSIKGLLQGDLKAQVTPSGWPLYHHAMINDANGNVHFINQIRTSDFTSGIKTSLPIANIKNCWILASDLQSWSKSQGWNLLPQSIKNIYDANSDQISVLAQNQGIITVGFEVYNSHHDGLLLNANADVYQLLNNDAKNILLFNNNGKNSGWIDNEIVQKLLNQKELLKAKGTQIIAPSKYSESKTKIRLHSEHYDMNQFLTANIDDSNFDKNGKIDLSSQIALAHNDSRIIESLKKIKEQLIDQWIAMGIRHFNVIPIMVNSYFKVSGISQIGDILFSNQTNNNGLNVYVIYDWLDTLNAGFMVAPYSAAYQNIYKTKPIANQLVYNWKLASNPTIELNYQISLVSADNNYGITTLEPPDLKVNLNSMIMKEMMLQSIHDANSSLVMVIQSIGVLTVILTIVQVTVTMNIILKSNINTINLLKAFGYNKFWIFNRLFMIYIPLIILSGILAFPFGYLVSYFTYQVVIRASHIFTPFTVNLPTIFIIIVVMLVLFAIILIIVMWYNNHHYPVHKFIG